MFAPEPMLERKLSCTSSLFSQSTALGESSSKSNPPLHMSVAALSLGCGGLGSVVAAQIVLMESVAFLERVYSSITSRFMLAVLSKSISICWCLISSRFQICICEYDTFGVNGIGMGGGCFVRWLLPDCTFRCWLSSAGQSLLVSPGSVAVSP